MGLIVKRVGHIVVGFVVVIVTAIPFQMILPFPVGFHAAWISIIVFTVLFALITYYKTKDSGKSPQYILEER